MPQQSTCALGFWSAGVAMVAAVGYGVVQTLQLLGLLGKPWDDILIFGFSISIASPFVLTMVALHYVVPEEKRVWTHAAVVFAGMYATLVSLVYMTELAVTIPRTLQGAAGDVEFVTLREHSFFWAVDALGYVFMSVATLVAAPAFSREGLQLWLRWFFIAHGVQAPLIALILYYPRMLLLDSPWIVTGPGLLLLLAIFFRRERDRPAPVARGTPTTGRG